MGMQGSRSLIAGYPFEGNCNDVMGVNNGTPANITYVDGVFGKAASFNGSGSKVDLGLNSLLKPESDFSVSMWVKGKGTGVNSAGFGNVGDSGKRGWELGFTSNNKVYFFVPISNIRLLSAVYDNHNDSEFTHYCGVALIGEKVKLYRNTVLIAESTVVLTSIYGGNSIATTIGISRGLYYFSGLIENAKLYNKALTQAEIQRDYLNLPIF